MAESTILYRAIMAEFERQRIALGVAMSGETRDGRKGLDNLAGVADGYYAKCLYPDTSSGRRAGWRILDEFAVALFGRDFRIRIDFGDGVATAPATDELTAATIFRLRLNERHWRHSRFYQELGAKGGRARAIKHPGAAAKFGSRGGKAKSKKLREIKRALAKTGASGRRGPATSL